MLETHFSIPKALVIKQFNECSIVVNEQRKITIKKSKEESLYVQRFYTQFKF